MPSLELDASQRLILSDALLYRCWDQMGVVYDDSNGSTVLLEGFSAGVLELLVQAGPQSRAELLKSVNTLADDPSGDPESFLLNLEETLEVFVNRGWISEAPVTA